MSKTEAMSQQIGGYLDASIGKREAAVSPAPPAEAGTAAQFEGRVRHRNACLIRLDRILPDPDQPRKHFDPAELQKLADSLKSRGQLQPCRVRFDPAQNAYVLLMGERRFRAAQLAGLESLECIVHDAPLSEDDRYELALIENLLRQDLNPIEEASGYAKLLQRKKCSARSLAQELSVNVSTVSRSLSLLKLPADMQEHIAAGRLPAGVAREIAKLDDEAKQREMVERFFAEGLTSADTAAAVSGKGPKGKAAAQATRKTITLPGGIKVTLAGRKRHSNAELAAACRQAAEILEADGRGKGKKAA